MKVTTGIYRIAKPEHTLKTDREYVLALVAIAVLGDCKH